MLGKGGVFMSDSQDLANAYLKYINEINQQFTDYIKPALEQLEITLQPMHDVSKMIQKMQEDTLESLQPAMEAIREFSKQSVFVNKKITEAIQYRNFYSTQSLLLSKSNDEIHDLVSQFDEALSDVELGNVELPLELVKNEQSEKTSKTFQLNSEWLKEQFCGYLAQSVFGLIFQYAFGLITSDTVVKVLKIIVAFLKPSSS